MIPNTYTEASIMVVDDKEANARLLERILRFGKYKNVTCVLDPREVMERYAAAPPDLLLLDLQMPHLDGYAVMDALKHKYGDALRAPILVLTADITSDAKRRALEYGARDFLTKPFDPVEVLLRIRNLLEMYFLHRELQTQNRTLEEKVAERTAALESMQVEALMRLARAAEYRDDETGQHTQRVGHWSALLAAALGVPVGEVELIRQAAPLHDVGKIGIPDAILLSPNRLTSYELAVMRTHAKIGAGILAASSSALMQLAEQIALNHHERWDGSGYPNGLQGEDIPLSARIVAIVDVFDALTHDRPYKQAWSIEAATAELERQRGRHFDPQLVTAFLQVLERESMLAVEPGMTVS